ncbi:hypothetical protein AXG93_2528s2040 [Marchantia polymorpha subsp. ruderalis]|uniref:Uncharacterized protein n=1 Tax=Marchantia polymorpha subsp. ruderalis TaxID=1480154 RepID=A0A176WRC2_MARPO|nr:hypothetical protein AXG93_2528s2040 [Marchantia polymorpha subsp. ruderalis]
MAGVLSAASAGSGPVNAASQNPFDKPYGLMGGTWMRPSRSWVVKTESNVRREKKKLPDPPCVICKGTGKVRTNKLHGACNATKGRMAQVVRSSAHLIYLFSNCTPLFSEVPNHALLLSCHGVGTAAAVEEATARAVLGPEKRGA